MTVTITSIVAGPFTLTGGDDALPFDFLVITAPELEVYTKSGDVETIISPADYTVTLNEEADGSYAEGGMVTVTGKTGQAYVRANPYMTQEQIWNNQGSRLKNLNEGLDRAAIVSLRQNYDLQNVAVGQIPPGVVEAAVQAVVDPIIGDLATQSELAAVETSASAAASAAAAANTNANGRAATTGSNLTDSDARAFRERLGMFGLPVELYGAIADDISVDNASFINAAETAAALLGVSVVFQEGADYYFKDTLRGARDRLVWIGNRTRLIYNGASPTKDLIVFGNEARVTNTYQNANPPLYFREMEVIGLEVCSRTVMTSGWAVRTPGCVRSNFGFIVQSQDFCEEMVNAGIGTARNGVCTWNGIWAQIVDNNTYEGDSLNAYNTCFAVNGYLDYVFSGTTYSGPKADCWPIYGKISQGRGAATTDSAPAVVMGGGFGGLYLSPMTTYIGNCVNLRVDQSLTAEGNRELFCTGSIFDVALGANNYNVEILDPGGVLINAAPVWISAGQGGGLLIGASSSGQLVGSALRIRGHQKHGLTILSPNFFINVAALQVHNNGLAADSGTAYWGINGAVANYSLTYVGLSAFSNGYLGAQNINPNFANTGISDNSRARFPNLDVRQRTYFGADANFWMGEGDAPNYNPSMLFDSGDAMFYDRAGNSLAVVIGSAVVFRAVGDRILIRDNTAILPGTGTPEGIVTANPGSLFQRTDNGTIYRKGSGTGNTGWVLMT